MCNLSCSEQPLQRRDIASNHNKEFESVLCRTLRANYGYRSLREMRITKVGVSQSALIRQIPKPGWIYPPREPALARGCCLAPTAQDATTQSRGISLWLQSAPVLRTFLSVAIGSVGHPFHQPVDLSTGHDESRRQFCEFAQNVSRRRWGILHGSVSLLLGANRPCHHLSLDTVVIAKLGWTVVRPWLEFGESAHFLHSVLS